MRYSFDVTICSPDLESALDRYPYSDRVGLIYGSDGMATAYDRCLASGFDLDIAMTRWIDGMSTREAGSGPKMETDLERIMYPGELVAFLSAMVWSSAIV